MLKNGKFYLGIAIIKLSLYGNNSLKGKRSVLNRIKSRVKNTFNVAISEVGGHDLHQSSTIAVSSVSPDKIYLEGQLAKLVDFVGGISDAVIADYSIHIEIKGINDNVFI